ncbi:exosortase system-associated protein, TIGR04073 family [Nitrosomonas marina]|nr:exosortase system-associated protein, TIGR04073 family [Nitrosomonas marina]
MMRTCVCLLMLCLSLLFSSSAIAQESATDTYFSKAGMKILSGVANVATGWLELPKNIILWNQREQSQFIGWTEGILRGAVHTASRTGSGVLDLATFWLPTYPTPNPSLIWDDFYQESEYLAFRTGG